MRLTDDQIAEFQRLHKKHYGVWLSKNEAGTQGLALINLMKKIYSPITKQELDDLIKSDLLKK